MKRIYTRTGDDGTTGIHGRIRVAKSDIRIEANGTLDELNVAIGIVRSMLPTDHSWQTMLRDIQLNLMCAMSLVATRSDMREANPNYLPECLVPDIERFIDDISAANTPSEYFILPGGTQLSAFLHQARVVARRAERRLWTLNEIDPVPRQILAYVNRLSDLFFEMSRSELAGAGMTEERWNAFAYKRKK